MSVIMYANRSTTRPIRAKQLLSSVTELGNKIVAAVKKCKQTATIQILRKLDEMIIKIDMNGIKGLDGRERTLTREAMAELRASSVQMKALQTVLDNLADETFNSTSDIINIVEHLDTDCTTDDYRKSLETIYSKMSTLYKKSSKIISDTSTQYHLISKKLIKNCTQIESFIQQLNRIIQEQQRRQDNNPFTAILKEIPIVGFILQMLLVISGSWDILMLEIKQLNVENDENRMRRDNCSQLLYFLDARLKDVMDASEQVLHWGTVLQRVNEDFEAHDDFEDLLDLDKEVAVMGLKDLQDACRRAKSTE